MNRHCRYGMALLFGGAAQDHYICKSCDMHCDSRASFLCRANIGEMNLKLTITGVARTFDNGIGTFFHLET